MPASSNGALRFFRRDDYLMVSECGRYAVVKSLDAGAPLYSAQRRAPLPAAWIAPRLPTAQDAMDACEADSGAAGGLQQCTERLVVGATAELDRLRAAAAHATPAQRIAAGVRLAALSVAITMPLPGSPGELPEAAPEEPAPMPPPAASADEVFARV